MKNKPYYCNLSEELKVLIEKEKAIYLNLFTEVNIYINLHSEEPVTEEYKKKLGVVKEKGLKGNALTDYLIQELNFYWYISPNETISEQSIEIKTDTETTLYLQKQDEHLAGEIIGKLLTLLNRKIDWEDN